MTAREGEPGYCIACHGYHLTTPAPGWGGPACGNCIVTRRLDPPEQGPRHVCNTSDRLKPGHPEYRQCSCGQWYHSSGGYWYRVSRPPRTLAARTRHRPRRVLGLPGRRPRTPVLRGLRRPQAHPPHAPPLAIPRLSLAPDEPALFPRCITASRSARNPQFLQHAPRPGPTRSNQGGFGAKTWKIRESACRCGGNVLFCPESSYTVLVCPVWS